MSERAAEIRGDAPEGSGARPCVPGAPRHWRLLLGVILLVALGVRVVHFLDFREAPFVGAPVVDSAHFDWKARQIASGRLVGNTAFQKGPLYSFVLAAVYRVTGGDIETAILLQLLAGVAVCWLIFRLGRSLFGITEGLLAAAWAAVYRPLVFYEGQLLAAWLAVLVIVLFLLALADATRRPAAWRWLGAGVLLGLAVLVRGNALVVGAFGVVWAGVVVRRRGTTTAAALAAASFAAGLLLPVVPATVHNWLAEGEIVPLTSTAGVNLYTGNRPGADGYSAIGVHSEWQSAMDEAHAAGASGSAAWSRYWTRKALAFARSRPWEQAGLLWRKLVLFWDAFEYPNNVSLEFCKRYSRVLRWPVPGFGAAATLALAGLVVLARRRRDPVLLLGGFLASYSVSVALFFACDRYRLPAVPALLCLAAATLTWGVRRLRERDVRRTGLAVVALAIAGTFVHVDWYGSRSANDARDWLAVGDAHRFAGRTAEAIRAYRASAEADPSHPDAFALMGRVFYQAGRWRDAEARFREALRLDPDYALPRILLARLLFDRGRTEESIEQLRILQDKFPTKAEPYFLLGRCLARRGNYPEALDAHRRAVELRPDFAAAHHAIARILLADPERAADALAAAEKAATLAPVDADVLMTLSLARGGAGDLEGALRAASRACAAAPANPAPRRRVAELEAALERERLRR